MNKDFEDFKEYLLNTKKVSKNTYDAYIRDVSVFISYCTEKGIDSFSLIDLTFINGFNEFYENSGKSESSKSRMIASVRTFFKFLQQIGKIDDNPTYKIKLKKIKQNVPGILEQNEILKLINQPNTKDYKGCRDKAILELLYATGIKVSELISIKLTDINLQLGLLKISSQNGRERIIPIYPEALKSINDYVTVVRPSILYGTENQYLFVNMNGNQLSRQGLWKIIKYYAALAGINKDITPNTIRHSFATHLLENGAELNDIKEMLGHIDIASTQIYSTMLKNKYAKSYSRFHPMAK